MRTLLNIAPNFFHAFYKASQQKETTKAILRPFEGGSEQKDFTLIIWYSLHLYWDENGIIYCWIDLLTANRWAGGNQLLNQVWFCGKTSSRAGLVTVWWFCIFPTFLAVLVFQKPNFKLFIKLPKTVHSDLPYCLIVCLAVSAQAVRFIRDAWRSFRTSSRDVGGSLSCSSTLCNFYEYI